MSNTVLCEIRDGIATLTLNRPDRLNAVSYELADALLAHLDDLEVDDRVRAVILTGAGGKAFSAGGDIHEFYESVKQGPARAVRDFVRRGQAMTARIEAFPKPRHRRAAPTALPMAGGLPRFTEASSTRPLLSMFAWASGRPLASPSGRSPSGTPSAVRGDSPAAPASPGSARVS